jgi:hypothetical protein
MGRASKPSALPRRGLFCSKLRLTLLLSFEIENRFQEGRTIRDALIVVNNFPIRHSRITQEGGLERARQAGN